MTASVAVTPALASRRAERLFIPAVFVTNLGNNIQVIAAALLVFKASNTAFAISWVFIAMAVPQVLLSWLFGRLADRYDRRLLCVFSDIGSALAAAALPVWLIFGDGKPDGAVYVTSLVLSMTAAMFMPASNALMKERIVPEQLGKFNANYEIAAQAGFLMSAAVGGFMVQILDPKAVFFINALTFVGSAVCIFAMGRKPFHQPLTAAEQAAKDEAAKLAAPAVRPILRLAALYIVGSVVILVVNMILLVLVVERFKQGAGILGLIDAAAGVGIMIAAWHYKRIKDKVDWRILIVLGYVGTGIVDMLMPISVFTLLPLILLGGYTFGVARLAARTTLMKVVDDDKVGRIFGVVNAVGLAFSLVCTVGLARVTDTVGVVSSFILLGLWGIVPTVLIVGSLLRTRLEGEPAPVVPVPVAEPALEAKS